MPVLSIHCSIHHFGPKLILTRWMKEEDPNCNFPRLYLEKRMGGRQGRQEQGYHMRSTLSAWVFPPPQRPQINSNKDKICNARFKLQAMFIPIFIVIRLDMVAWWHITSLISHHCSVRRHCSRAGKSVTLCTTTLPI